MVQVLPGVPTFGQNLIASLSQATGNIAEGLAKRNANKALQSLFSPVQGQQQGIEAQDQNLSPIQRILNQPEGPTMGQALTIHNIAEKAMPGSGTLVGQFLGNQQNIAARERLQKQKFEHEEEKVVGKENRELRDNIIDSYESARISQANINKLRAVSKESATPLTAYVSQLTGIPLDLWASPESEEFKKLIAQRGLNVAKSYGLGRILQIEFENFMKTMPSLLNTKEGRDRIFKTFDYLDNISVQRYKEYKNIIQENKGKVPADLKAELTKRMESAYDKFGDVLLYGDELIDVMSPQGEKGKIPKNQLQQAVEEGFTLPGEH